MDMDKTSELKAILGDFLKWNNARLVCFTQMLLALFAVRTVNLRELAVAFSSDALIDSRYKRLKRFFAGFKIDMDIIARWAFKLFFQPTEKLYLTIDRTNWFWGKAKINILTLGVAYEGVAIPLLWNFLDKAGNATAAEHQAILERFVNIFGKECIEGVLADREFASGDLFQWFNRNKIPFYIRIKEDSIVRIKNKDLFKAERIFRELNPKENKVFSMVIELFGQKVSLAGSRSERGELMIVATNKDVHNAIPIYLRRWEVETLFACLKSRGFRFEETHLTKLDRIEKLMALLAIGFCWAHKVGEWKAAKKPIILNKHRDSRRPQNSYFRYGFDWIRDSVLHITRKQKEFKACLAQISSVFSNASGALC
jgi:hypothetical protein